MHKVDIFNTVKQIPFNEVQALFNGEEPKRGKIPCPFHEERTPSFQVYDDGFKCFGCGVHGDSIDFIAKLENVRPIEAARMIAERFNLPVDRPASKQESQKVNELKRRRIITKRYKELEEKAYLNMANFRSDVLRMLEVCGLDDLDDGAVEAVHMLPELEHKLHILATGTEAEKLELFREGGLIAWAKLS